jgi:hypothetical protein
MWRLPAQLRPCRRDPLPRPSRPRSRRPRPRPRLRSRHAHVQLHRRRPLPDFLRNRRHHQGIRRPRPRSSPPRPRPPRHPHHSPPRRSRLATPPRPRPPRHRRRDARHRKPPSRIHPPIRIRSRPPPPPRRSLHHSVRAPRFASAVAQVSRPVSSGDAHSLLYRRPPLRPHQIPRRLDRDRQRAAHRPLRSRLPTPLGPISHRLHQLQQTLSTHGVTIEFHRVHAGTRQITITNKNLRHPPSYSLNSSLILSAIRSENSSTIAPSDPSVTENLTSTRPDLPNANAVARISSCIPGNFVERRTGRRHHFGNAQFYRRSASPDVCPARQEPAPDRDSTSNGSPGFRIIHLLTKDPDLIV